MCFFQFIVWHSWTEVVYMVITDAASQPLQYFRQLIVRTAINSSFYKIPFILIFEVRILKLMLHIKQPDPQRSCYKQNRKLDNQKCLPADRPNQQTVDHHDRRIDDIRVHTFRSEERRVGKESTFY